MIRFVLVLCFLVFCCVGCAPSFPQKISLSIPETPQGVHRSKGSVVPIQVREIEDDRSVSWVIKIKDGREVEPIEDVRVVATNALKRSLVDFGYEVIDSSASFTLLASLKRWDSEVSVSFPSSESVATARLEVFLLNEKDEVVYRAEYAGDLTTKRPMIEDKVPDMLAEAFSLAIGELLIDRGFIEQLRAF